jgi:hypothetical protein
MPRAAAAETIGKWRRTSTRHTPGEPIVRNLSKIPSGRGWAGLTQRNESRYGDHQPMHVTDRGDRGGNEFKVTYNGRTRCRESNSSGTEAKVELHSAWDSCLVFTLERGHGRI